ncbi:MAG: fused response regulator/phosphatase [Candidatus Marinimicrobia bacterium]|nr:fused response regulator/phosphatase [Candidatus Neomarinimicrobiota bacterium]
MNKKNFLVEIVDDKVLNQKVLEAILEKNNFHTITASNGQEARQMAEEQKPDIILMDIMMPVEDGFEACKKLKKNPLTADIPVIFISALDNAENKVEGLSIGGIDYITKPFNKEEVLVRVKNYLKLYQNYQHVIDSQTEKLLQLQHAQKAILEKPEDLPEAKFTVAYRPIVEAGGDFYDVFESGEGIMEYFVADISGHDIGASFATSALKALVRNNSSQLYTLTEIASTINKILCTIFKFGQHITAAYLRIDRKRYQVSFVNAAHLPIIYIPKEGKVRLMEANNGIIGAFKESLFVHFDMQVEAGDRFLLFTDGLVESFEKNKMSREEGIKKITGLIEKYREMPINELTTLCLNDMFCDGRIVEDDIVILMTEV